MWENIPPAPETHNLCQGTLKLFWWLIVAQSPAKTLTIDVPFILAAPLFQPSLTSALISCHPALRVFLVARPIEREHIYVCVCVPASLGLVQLHV